MIVVYYNFILTLLLLIFIFVYELFFLFNRKIYSLMYFFFIFLNTYIACIITYLSWLKNTVKHFIVNLTEF